MTTPDPQTGGGGPQTTNCLPLDYLNGFLFGIKNIRQSQYQTVLDFLDEWLETTVKKDE